ncbi:unnamed protein product [Prunus armeniaca]
MYKCTNSKSTSSAQPKLGERLPERARDGSSAGPVARFHGGSHEPEEAQEQVLPGLKPEFGDVSAGVTLTSPPDSSNGRLPCGATGTLGWLFSRNSTVLVFLAKKITTWNFRNPIHLKKQAVKGMTGISKHADVRIRERLMV